jgi:uncharacterized protein YndB with AHSA1/START domain
MPGSFEGYLLIADITGYTLYLTQSELEHAEEILEDLLKLLVEHTRPPLVLSRLAGDAVISYALSENFIQGQTFIELIEETYVAFRKALERMVLNNTCRCNACTNIANLDLKFFTHYGRFAVQHIGDHPELVGSDVNLLHRLLKNRVVEDTGIRAYTLYTQAVVQNLGLQDFCQGMVQHSESYEHLGEVQTFIQDLQPVWEAKLKASSLSLPPEKVLLQWQIDFDLPPERVWDYLSQPEYRKTLLRADRNEVHKRENGRISAGSEYHCFHGDQVIPQTVLEWQPFERILTKDRPPVPFQEIYLYTEYQLVPITHGTRLTMRVSKAVGPQPGRWLVDQHMLKAEEQGHEDMESFKSQIEAAEETHPPQEHPAILVSAEMLSLEARHSLQDISRAGG